VRTPRPLSPAFESVAPQPMTATVVPFHSSPEPAFVPERVPASEAEPRAVEVAEDFETLRDRGRELGNKGSYREAAVVYRRAAQVAAAAGDDARSDEAVCGWATAETELGNGARVMPELRQVLLRSAVEYNCWLASYALARAHELEGQVKKALFYARLSLHHSACVDRPGSMAGSHNLLGNLLLTEGCEADAAAEYRKALRESRDARPTWVAGVEGNLGYAIVARAGGQGLRSARVREGLRLLYRSLRTFQRAKAGLDAAISHLDVCFAHLELKRPRTAKRHGERALALAEAHGDSDTVKNCLYLLGQTAMLEGESERAQQYFGELERRFYPGRAGLANVLMSLDLRQVVNLRV